MLGFAALEPSWLWLAPAIAAGVFAVVQMAAKPCA